MEPKIFRDTLPQAGTSCTVKAELPLETEILISDYLPPVFKLVKCFAKPVVLQKQLQPGRLTLEGYLRCTVFYQGEDGAGLCQTEQKLPFTKQLEVPEFSFTSWMAMVEGQTEYLNCRAVNPHRIEVRGAYGLVVTIHTQDKQELITALADGGIEQKLQTLNGVRSTAVLEKLVISRLYGREIDSLLATWGISLILQQAARSIFGAQGVNVNAPKFLSGGLTVAGCTFSYNRLFILGLVLVCLGGVGLLMYRTAFGRQVRAVMQNRPMAQCTGINSRRVDSLTFSLGSGLAGLAGCSLALLGSIDATVGQNYIVNSFMAVVLGGVGRLLGTVVGSTAIGGASIFAENYTSATIAKAIVLLLVIVFLQKRPQGLFTIRSRSLDD